MASGPWAGSAPEAVSDLIASDQPLQVFRSTAFSESPDASTRLESALTDHCRKRRMGGAAGTGCNDFQCHKASAG